MLNQSVFDYIEPGDELVGPPFERLAVDRQLWTKRFSGFWRSMDNFKDKITFDRMWARCDVPWHVGV
jgi:glucose-1-phosphate cytidylyltransferase